jgi:hypothetical protein
MKNTILTHKNEILGGIFGTLIMIALYFTGATDPNLSLGFLGAIGGLIGPVIGGLLGGGGGNSAPPRPVAPAPAPAPMPSPQQEKESFIPWILGGIGGLGLIMVMVLTLGKGRR